MKRALGLIGITAALLLAAPSAMAQPMGPPGPHGPWAGQGQRGTPRFSPQQRMERRVKMLKNRIGLNDATAKNVAKIMGKYQQQRFALRKTMRQHRQKLAQLVKADSNDQAAYRREILALQQARVAMTRLRDLQIAELQRVLTPKQQAKMLVEMGKFGRRMHHGRRGNKGRRGQGPGRGHGRGWR